MDIAFQSMSSSSIYTDCCNQSSLKHDYLLLFGLQTETKILPMPKVLVPHLQAHMQMKIIVDSNQKRENNYINLTLTYLVVTEGCPRTLYAFIRSSGSTLGPSSESWFCSSVRTVSSMLHSKRRHKKLVRVADSKEVLENQRLYGKQWL